jgi:hypothetical protein
MAWRRLLIAYTYALYDQQKQLAKQAIAASEVQH